MAKLKQHGNGTQTLSTFPVKNNTTKWFCIDIDFKKEIYTKPDFKKDEYINESNGLIKAYKDLLSSKGITSYEEDTGGKGYHLWIFFKPVATLDFIIKEILPLVKTVPYDKSIYAVEFFPTSANSRSVRLPEGRDLRYGKYSVFEGIFSTIQYCDQGSVSTQENPMDVVFDKCTALCSLKTKAHIDKHLRHHERCVVASMMASFPQKEPIAQWLTENIFKPLDNYDETITQRQMWGIGTRAGVYSCEKIIELGICQERCKTLGEYSNPVGFWWSLAKEAEQRDLSKATLINPQDFIGKHGNGYYIKGKEGQWIKISDFVIDLDKWVEETDEDNNDKSYFEGRLITKVGDVFPLVVPIDDYTQDSKFEVYIRELLKMRNGLVFDSSRLRQIKLAIEKSSNPVIVKRSKNFGFNKDKSVYYTPSVKISKDGIEVNNDLVIEIGQKAGEIENYLDMTINEVKTEAYWKEFYLETYSKLYPNKALNMILFGHAFNVFMKHLYIDDAVDNPYILWIAGDSGKGKTGISLTIQRLFGRFPKPFGTSSTPNRAELTGYLFKDAVLLIDDFKFSSIGDNNKREYLTVLQNYSDKTGRSRMTKAIGTQKTFFMRCNLIINGEDVIQQESSNIARMLILDVNKDDIKQDGELYQRIQEETLDFNSFTPCIARYCLNLDPDEVSMVFKQYLNRYGEMAKGKANGPRVSLNIAKMRVTAHYAVEYFYGKESEVQQEVDSYINAIFDKMLSLVDEENVGNKFWSALLELLATGKAIISDTDELQGEYERRPVVGFTKNGKVYIIPKTAYKEVRSFLKEVNPLNHSSGAILKSLASNNITESSEIEPVEFNGTFVGAVRLADIAKDELKDATEKEEKDTKPDN